MLYFYIAATGLNARSFAVIIIFRFHLYLQKMNAHHNANNTWRLSTLATEGSYARPYNLQEAVVGEFEDTGSNALETQNGGRASSVSRYPSNASEYR